MNQICMRRRRCLNRRLRRVTTRRLAGKRRTRRTIRLVVGGRQVNHLSQAIKALTRGARVHQRLMKLAPEQFDRAVMNRLALEREEHERNMVNLTAALDKVYGPREEDPHQGQNDFWCGHGLESVWFSEAKKEKLERLSCEKKLWMAAGHAALDRHKRLQPHRQFSLSMIARLLDIGSVLGRLSVGLPLS